MSLNDTDNGPPIAHPSACLKRLLFIVNVTSVANFNIKRLKMSKLFSISFYCICDLEYN